MTLFFFFQGSVNFNAEIPQERYFHSWELVKAENVLYVHGGMNTTHYFDDLWKFDLLRRTWEKLVHYRAGLSRSFPLAGITLWARKFEKSRPKKTRQIK